MKIIILAFFLSLIFFITTVNAQVSVSCPSCYINNCQCSIANCTNGGVRIYNTSDCSGVPIYYIFSSASLTWNPSQTGNYYFKVLCSDENVSACTTVGVSSIQTTTTTQGGTTGGGTTSGGTTAGVQTTSTTTAISPKCSWIPPPLSVLGQCEAILGWYYNATLKRCVTLSGCRKPVDMPFSSGNECKLTCELANIETCDQECKKKGYDAGVCRNWVVYPTEKMGCETNETDIKETSDCYLEPGLMGVGRTCCCSGKRITTTTTLSTSTSTISPSKKANYLVISIVFILMIAGTIIYFYLKSKTKVTEEEFGKLKEKWGKILILFKPKLIIRYRCFQNH
jgi:hypothetical protein